MDKLKHFLKIERLDINDIILCTPYTIEDFRGTFTESYRTDKLHIHGYSINFVKKMKQINLG